MTRSTEGMSSPRAACVRAREGEGEGGWEGGRGSGGDGVKGIRDGVKGISPQPLCVCICVCARTAVYPHTHARMCAHTQKKKHTQHTHTQIQTHTHTHTHKNKYTEMRNILKIYKLHKERPCSHETLDAFRVWGLRFRVSGLGLRV
jgi:hypothetical protein